MMKQVTAIGIAFVEMTCKVASLPQPGVAVNHGRFIKKLAGKAIRQAVAVAKSGGEISLLTAIGDDSFGQDFTRYFQQNQIKIDFLTEEKNGATGVKMIFEDPAGGQLLAFSEGVANNLNPEKIDEARFVISGSEFILMSSELPEETLSYLFDLTKSLGKKVIFNPDQQFRATAGNLKNLYFLVCTTESFQKVFEFPINTKTDLKQSSSVLQKWGIKNVVIFDQEFGAICSGMRGSRFIFEELTKFKYTSEIIDIFSGALAAALSKGENEIESVKYGEAAVSYAISQNRESPEPPTETEVKNYMKQTSW